MFYRLEDLVCNPKLKGSEVLYGDQFMKLRIHNIALVSEDTIDLNLLKNTLLVVTAETNREDTEKFIKSIGKRKLGGVLVLDRRSDPHAKNLISDFFKKHAEFCVYLQTDFLMGEVVLDIMQDILARKNENLNQISSISETFRSLDEKNYDSKQAVYVLSDLLGRDVTLTNFKNDCVVSTLKQEFDPSYTQRRKLINDETMHELYYREIIDYGNVMHVRLVCEIYHSQQYLGSLYIDEAETFVREQDYAVIELTVKHIRKRTLFNDQLHQVVRYQQDKILLALFHGRYRLASHFEQACEQLGLDGLARYRVVLWNLYEDEHHVALSVPDTLEHLYVVDHIVEELRQIWPTFAYRIDEHQIQFLVEDTFENDMEFKRYIHDTVGPVAERYKELKVSARIAIGDVSDVKNIHVGYHQIRDVMRTLAEINESNL